MLNPINILDSDFPAYKDPTVLEGVQTGNHANSAAPSSATLSNTAAGYTTLGGKWQFVPVAGAETDYALFAYQVPATHRLFVSGVAITSMIATTLGAVLETLEWAVGVNSTAVSLATTDSTPVFGPRRVQLGLHNFASLAAAGTQASDIVRQFSKPLIIQPSRYFHVIVRVVTGTTTGLIRGQVMVDGSFRPITD